MNTEFYKKKKFIVISFVVALIGILTFGYFKVFIQSNNSQNQSQNINNKIYEEIENKEESDSMQKNESSISIIVNGNEYIAKLENNETAKSFVKFLPIEINMNELNGNEKYYFLNQKLPTNHTIPSKINNGDIMIYGNNCLVIFYESFKTSYSYTKIGKIENVSGLKSELGNGNINIKFKNN